MLNKIKLVGKVLPLEIKEKKEDKELMIFFSLMVPNPSGVITILRCAIQGEKAERFEKEIQEDDIIEVKGYLRNEKEGRQILTKVIEFTRLDLTFDKIDKENSNQVRLLGKIITDFKSVEEKKNPNLLNFKILVPRERDYFPLFFCRVQEEELIDEFNQKLDKGDVVLIEGFLQTKKIAEEGVDSEGEKKFSRISSIICQGFTFLDKDAVSVFSPLGKFTHIVKKIEKIDFSKPKGKEWTDE